MQAIVKHLDLKYSVKQMKWRTNSRPVVIAIVQTRDHDDNPALEIPVKTKDVTEIGESLCWWHQRAHMTIYPFDRHLISILFQTLRK